VNKDCSWRTNTQDTIQTPRRSPPEPTIRTKRRPIRASNSLSNMMGAFSVLFGTNDTVLALLPLVPPLIFAIPLLFANPTTTTESSSVCRSILAYFGVAVAGFIVTNSLIPNIKQYTLRKGISGKDLGKRGTSIADKDMYVDVNHSNFQILVDTFGLQRDTSKKDPKTTMP